VGDAHRGSSVDRIDVPFDTAAPGGFDDVDDLGSPDAWDGEDVVIQRSEDVISRDAEAAGDDETAGEPQATPTRGRGGAGAKGGGDPDELVNQLWDRLKSRMQQELRLDRERAGLVSDVRR
jgi:hypothetical protein